MRCVLREKRQKNKFLSDHSVVNIPGGGGAYVFTRAVRSAPTFIWLLFYHRTPGALKYYIVVEYEQTRAGVCIMLKRQNNNYNNKSNIIFPAASGRARRLSDTSPPFGVYEYDDL